MYLYNFVVYVVYNLIGTLGQNGLNSQLPLYPSTVIQSLNPQWDATFITQRGGFLFDKWNSLLQSNMDIPFWDKFLSDPKLVVSTFIWILCVIMVVEICIILPFRWFKRLLRYPNARLQTPNEVRRMRRK